jgi:hypothetical protein
MYYCLFPDTIEAHILDEHTVNTENQLIPVDEISKASWANSRTQKCRKNTNNLIYIQTFLACISQVQSNFFLLSHSVH